MPVMTGWEAIISGSRAKTVILNALRYLASISQALKGADVAPEEVDEVVLVGGCSQIPAVR